MKKEIYEGPLAEIILMRACDIITATNEKPGVDLPDDEW